MIKGTLAFGLVTALGFAVGCGSSGPSSSGTIPEPLEAIAITSQQTTVASASYSGAVAVTGADRDFVLSVSAPGGTTALNVHTPAASPIAAVAGEARTVEVMNEGFGSGPSLFVADDQGPVYAAVAGDGVALQAAEERFGAGFVRYGDEVGSQADGTFIWSYRKAVFKTDDGDVALNPGQVKSIRLGGTLYRAVVITSYQASTNPDATELPGCGPEDLLGFELFRVAEPVSAVSDLRRLAGFDGAFAGCSSPPGAVTGLE